MTCKTRFQGSYLRTGPVAKLDTYGGSVGLWELGRGGEKAYPHCKPLLHGS
jgi:hypothetical protein